MSVCPRMGLSMYIVFKLGASNPVSHMSRTITTLKGSEGSFMRSIISWRRCLFRMCSCHSGPSAAEPVITTFRTPFLSSLSYHSGRSLTISLCKSTQILRLMQTIMALPSSAMSRFSQWSTMSAAIRLIRSGLPTTFSRRDHLDLRYSLPSTSSKSSSRCGLDSGLSSILARRLS